MYEIEETVYLDSPSIEAGEFRRTVAPLSSHPDKDLVSGGAPRYPETLETSIQVGTGRPYAVDTIELPVANPWNCLFFCSGHDFRQDGSAYVCTMQGDVWHVTGIHLTAEAVRTIEDSQKLPGTVQWRRYASGLHQPLGLVVHEDTVYAMCRDQLVALHDLNKDGEADFYQCFSNAHMTSAGGHDYICGLERDREGRFYTSSSNQGVLRFSPDGQSVEVLAT